MRVPRHISYCFASVSGNPAGRKQGWEFVKANWSMIKSRLEGKWPGLCPSTTHGFQFNRPAGALGLLTYAITLPIRGFNSREMADEAEKVSAIQPISYALFSQWVLLPQFFTENPVPFASMALQRTLESMRSRARQKEQMIGELSKYLEAF